MDPLSGKTLTVTRTVRRKSFDKLVSVLSEKDVQVSICLNTPGIPQTFLKIVWCGSAGILLQDGLTREFFALENKLSVSSFQVSESLHEFLPNVTYILR